MEVAEVSNVFDEAAAAGIAVFVVAVIKSAVQISDPRWFPLLAVLVAVPVAFALGIANGEEYEGAQAIAAGAVQGLLIAMSASGAQGWLQTFGGSRVPEIKLGSNN